MYVYTLVYVYIVVYHYTYNHYVMNMCSLIENICEQIIADEQHTHKAERDSHSRPAKHIVYIQQHTKKFF
jgi:hypothetical protein